MSSILGEKPGWLSAQKEVAMFRSEVTTALCSLREWWPTDGAPRLDGGPEISGKVSRSSWYSQGARGCFLGPVRLPGKAGGNDKEGEGKMPRPGALKLQEGGSDVTVGTEGVFLLGQWMCKFQN